MADDMHRKIRKTLLTLHTWIGLTLGLGMVFLAITGAALVVRPMLDVPLNHKLMRVAVCESPLPIDTIVARATAAYPGQKVDSIEMSTNATSSVSVVFANDDYAYVDPCNGNILGLKNAHAGFFGTVDFLHRFHFMENGKLAAGSITALMTVIIVVFGVILWWPRSVSDMGSALRFKPSLPGLAKTLNLHRFIGIYTASLLFVLTVTAIPISFGWAKKLISDVTHSSVSSPQSPAAKLIEGRPLIPAEQVLLQAKADMPTLTWLTINYPNSKYSLFRVEVLEADAPHELAKSYLYYDANTGAALGQVHYRSGVALGRKVYLYSLALHRGLVWGIPYQLALLLVCLSVPVQLYSGASPYIRKLLRKRKKREASATPLMQLKLAVKELEAENIFRYEFAHPAGKNLPAFSAGSHIEIHLGDGITRQYSLCNDPNEIHRYVIAVLRTDDSIGGSARLHEEIEIGDVLEFSEPRNHFPLVQVAAPSILIAGGIGITPILCMAERLSSIGAQFDLHYAARKKGQFAFRDRINRSGFAEHVRYHCSEDGDRLALDKLIAAGDPKAHIYVCGPPRLIDAVVAAAREALVPDSQVHFEYFKPKPSDGKENRPFDVIIASTGTTIHVPADSSVVEALNTHGIQIPTSCSEGLCGTCIVRVLKGEIDHRDVVLSATDHKNNDLFTPCCSRALGSSLVLDL